MSELTALVRFVHLTAAIILAGGFAFHLFVAQPALSSTPHLATVRKDHWRTQLRVFRYCLAVLFATAVLGLWLQTANVGGSASTAFRPVFLLLTQTQFGRVWLARSAILIMIAILLIRGTEKHPANLFVELGFTLSAALLAALAFAGHAAA